MKIAILLTGHLRTFSKTWPNWKSLVEKYNADLYMHIWDNQGHRLDLPSSPVDPPQGPYSDVRINEDKIDLEELENFGIQNVIVENYNEVERNERFQDKVSGVLEEFSRSGLRTPKTLKGVYSQYYKRLKGIEYVMSKGDYSVVLLCRPDFIIGDFEAVPQVKLPPSDQLQRELTPDLFAAAQHKLHLTLLNDEDGYHDFYFLGSPDSIKKVCEIYNDDMNVFLNTWRSNKDRLACGHAYITSWINNHLKMERVLMGLLGWVLR